MSKHCILFYDVKVRRLPKFYRAMCRTLFWTQNSSFEGDLSVNEQKCLRNEIECLLNPEEDSVVLLWTPSSAAWTKTTLGLDKGDGGLIA